MFCSNNFPSPLIFPLCCNFWCKLLFLHKTAEPIKKLLFGSFMLRHFDGRRGKGGQGARYLNAINILSKYNQMFKELKVKNKIFIVNTLYKCFTPPNPQKNKITFITVITIKRLKKG